MTDSITTTLLLGGILAITIANLVVSYKHHRGHKRTYGRFSLWVQDQFEETRSLVKSVDNRRNDDERDSNRARAEMLSKIVR